MNKDEEDQYSHGEPKWIVRDTEQGCKDCNLGVVVLAIAGLLVVALIMGFAIMVSLHR